MGKRIIREMSSPIGKRIALATDKPKRLRIKKVEHTFVRFLEMGFKLLIVIPMQKRLHLGEGSLGTRKKKKH